MQPPTIRLLINLWAESVKNGDAVSFTSDSLDGGVPVQMGNNCPVK